MPPEPTPPVVVPMATCPPVKFRRTIAFVGLTVPSTVTRWKSTEPIVMPSSSRPVPASVSMMLVKPVTIERAATRRHQAAARRRSAARRVDVQAGERHRGARVVREHDGVDVVGWIEFVRAQEAERADRYC